MLYHFSENPDIGHFVPQMHPIHPDKPPLVWAIDESHAPLYFFPRDCPRVMYYPLPTTSAADRERFLGQTVARMVIAVEGGWLEQIREVDLYVYHLPEETFTCLDAGASYYTSMEPATPVKVERVGDLMRRLVDANVELRVTPSLWPLHDALVESTVHFSMVRMRNAWSR